MRSSYTAYNTARQLEASPVDQAERFMSELPPERAGFILAQFALSDVGPAHRQDQYVASALKKLDTSNADGILQPPLSEELASKIEAVLDRIDEFGRVSTYKPASLLLLAQAVDEGSRTV